MKHVTSLIPGIHKFTSVDKSKFPKRHTVGESLMFEASIGDIHIYCVGQKDSVFVYTEFINHPSYGVMVWSLPIKFSSKATILAKLQHIVAIAKNTDELHVDLLLSGFKLCKR